MKTKVALLALLAVIMLGITSCNKSDNAVNNSGSMYDSPQWMVAEPDNSPAEFTGGTLEEQFELVPFNQDIRNCDVEAFDDRNLGNKREFMPLAKILHILRLDADQMEKVRAFMNDYRLCVRQSIMRLREAEKALMAPFNEERRAIHQAFKNGEITREEAAAQLKALAERMREVLKNNNARVLECEAMKACRKQMLESIGSILTPEQYKKWQDWLSRLPEVDCNGRNTTGGKR